MSVLKLGKHFSLEDKFPLLLFNYFRVTMYTISQIDVFHTCMFTKFLLVFVKKVPL